MGEVKQINIKNWTNYFYNDIIDIKNFKSNLLKIDTKSYKDIGIYSMNILELKKLMTVKIFTVWILFIYLFIMRVDIFRKKAWINT